MAHGRAGLQGGDLTILGGEPLRPPCENPKSGAKCCDAIGESLCASRRRARFRGGCGPHAVQKYVGVPPYAEPRVYVQRVRILHQRYMGSPQG